ncbi:hypothetical protein O1Q96_24115 [Streptomyces sp. Qhu-G9]|uniref:hypothetical protein n=1 Tax=Streptomyces sp. Qhu-G9 TaxID=3452799 RepID=UPI0022AC7773|nr:hypothetical protein [Streptomyces aurantiacus]WAU82557.1 hypothetical protein O1Q96_24115 [Streptomyces aurantiacus]
MTDQETLTSLQQRRAVCPYPDCATGTIMDLVDQRMISPESREYEWSDFGEGKGALPIHPLLEWTQQECWICQLCGRSILEVIQCKRNSWGAGVDIEELTRLVLWPAPPPRGLPPARTRANSQRVRRSFPGRERRRTAARRRGVSLGR